MNRYELLLIVAVLIVATVVVIKSKWFDNFIKSLMRGTKPVDAADIKQEAKAVIEARRKLEQDLAEHEKNLRKEKKALKDL